MKVLIVDDELDLLELCMDAFEMFDHTPVGFTSPEEALVGLADGSFDAIVSDSKMPGMKGEDFFIQAKEILGDKLPPFFLATGALEATDANVKKLGMSGLISKPFDIEDLVKRVEAGVKA